MVRVVTRVCSHTALCRKSARNAGNAFLPSAAVPGGVWVLLLLNPLHPRLGPPHPLREGSSHPGHSMRLAQPEEQSLRRAGSKGWGCFRFPSLEALFPGSPRLRDLPLSQCGWEVAGLAPGPKSLLPPTRAVTRTGLVDVKTQTGLEVSRLVSLTHSLCQLPGKCDPTKDRRVQGSEGANQEAPPRDTGQF